MKTNRIYLIGTGTTVRLVRAPHRAQALAHVVRTTHTVSVATPEELVAHLTDGLKVENVTDGDTEELFEGAGHATTA